ncbi:MAG TPA: N-acetylmuramoyl-L-alanine amidase [Myxococcota bacterium]|nr:N-acetylmuramoyl-L-alanine amidase [Myxococcota bacterium]
MSAKRCSGLPAAFAVPAIAVLLSVPMAPTSGLGREFQPPYSGFSEQTTAFPYGAALYGLGVVVGAGHGWEGGLDGGFQRSQYKFTDCGTCEGITEDIYNAELVADHLVPLLRQAGARVYVVRQVDRNPLAVEVDDGDPGYSETGNWADGANVELGWGQDYRTHSVTYPGSATWNFVVPADGDYWVQARWAAGTNRCQSVRYTVVHPGGAAEYVVSQQRDGSMWVHLGRFYFPAGPASVTVDVPDGSSCYLVADAVRIGGGIDPDSEHPWWHVGAARWLGETGPAVLDGNNEVTFRPALANAIGADYFISVHADAVGTASVTGTSTYRYNCSSGIEYQSLDPATCDVPSGSADLQYAVHDAVLEDLRASWDPAWTNRGRLVANFGELRVLSGIPGILFESAYFTNVSTGSGRRMSDNQAMHDPRFRHILARAMVRGLIETVNPDAGTLADAPTHLAVRNVDGQLVASWRPVPGASGYRVYVARTKRAFDGGRLTTGASLAITDVGPGSMALVRVTALNSAGESDASDAVAASPGGRGDSSILIVNGFDRQDAWVREDFNHRDYSFEHGQGLLDAGFGFDGASDEAVVDGDVSLAGYGMVDWILGRESTEAETFNASAQSVVSAYLDGGGCVVASGTEVAWDLGARGGSQDIAFMAAAFGAEYVSDDAGTRSVSPEDGGPFETVAPFSFDGLAAGVYDPRYPDELTPVGGAVAALRYSTGGVAAVAFERSAGRSILAGFPFETISDSYARSDVMGAAADFCRVDYIDQGDPTTGDLTTGDDLGSPGDNGPVDGSVVGEINEIDVFEPDDGGAGQPDAASGDLAVTDGLEHGDCVVPNVDEGQVDPSDVPTDRQGGADTTPDSAWLTDLPISWVRDTSGGGGGGCSFSSSSPVQGWSLVLLLMTVLVPVGMARRAGRRTGNGVHNRAP